MVIGKPGSLDQRERQALQRGEELGRPAYPGKGEHAMSGQRRRQKRHQIGAQQGLARRQPGGDAGPVVADQQDRVRSSQAALRRLAQRAGRQHAAIAEAVLAIDRQQRPALRDGRILEPVIEQRQRGAGRRCGAHRCGAVAGDPAGSDFGQQQRLVGNRGAVNRSEPRQSLAVVGVGRPDHDRGLENGGPRRRLASHLAKCAGARRVIRADRSDGIFLFAREWPEEDLDRRPAAWAGGGASSPRGP